jgi:hypothetical protein
LQLVPASRRGDGCLEDSNDPVFLLVVDQSWTILDQICHGFVRSSPRSIALKARDEALTSIPSSRSRGHAPSCSSPGSARRG